MEDKPTLKVSLSLTGTFKVLEQAADITAGDWDTKQLFTASNGWRIVSSSQPEVDSRERILYLRGHSKTRDLNECDFYEETYGAILVALVEYAIIGLDVSLIIEGDIVTIS